METKKLSKEIIEKLMEFSTPEISDALNKFGIMGGCAGIKSVIPGGKIVGPCLTVRKLPANPINPKRGGEDYLDLAHKGDVLVIDNGGRMDCTGFGEILALACKKGGFEGTVIHGCCRDIESLKQIGYPVFSKGTYMQTGKDLTQIDAINVPISISNILVKPGDIIVGDDNGVLVIPQEIVEKVLEMAKGMREIESLIKKSIDKRSERDDTQISLSQVIRKYLDLQKPRE